MHTRELTSTILILAIGCLALIAVMSGCGAPAIYKAAISNDLKSARDLIAEGVDINVKWEGDTPLIAAALKGHEEVAQLLVENGADIDATNNVNATALYASVQSNSIVLAELLIARGADITIEITGGWTALHKAAWDGHIKMARLLIKHGAVETIHIAAALGDEAFVAEKLSAGADIDVKGLGGYRLLHFATWAGQEQMVKFLLARGAKTNAPSAVDVTPLYLAAEGNRLAIAKLLIAENAFVNAPKSGGWMPLDIAVINKHTEMVAFLKANGAKRRARPVQRQNYNQQQSNPLFQQMLHRSLGQILRKL